MTTTEALAVVREALHQAVGFDRAGSLVSHPYEQTYHVIATGCDDALTALALIEERMGEVEAERDEARQYLQRAEKQTTAAEQRVAELEAALREIKEMERERDIYREAEEMRVIARRALGGGE